MGDHKKELTDIQEDALHDLEDNLKEVIGSDKAAKLVKKINFQSKEYTAIFDVSTLVFYQR